MLSGSIGVPRGAGRPLSGGIRILSGGVGGAGSRGVAPGLRGQVVEFRLRVPQSLGFAAEDAFCGAFDSLAEFGDIGAGGAFGSVGSFVMPHSSA